MAMVRTINPEKALVFRITHRMNVPWILENGMPCSNSALKAPHYFGIGNPELIEMRRSRIVPIPPGGTLGDYVPFYFTPFSPMMYNIKTGYGGITKVANKDIVVFVTSLHKLVKLGHPFLFTDKHAYLEDANYYDDTADLGHIDWDILQRRDFKRDIDDLEKTARYQAEALVHRIMPIRAMIGIVCYTQPVKTDVIQAVNEFGLDLRVDCLPRWYFE